MFKLLLSLLQICDFQTIDIADFGIWIPFLRIFYYSFHKAKNTIYRFKSKIFATSILDFARNPNSSLFSKFIDFTDEYEVSH